MKYREQQLTNQQNLVWQRLKHGIPSKPANIDMAFQSQSLGRQMGKSTMAAQALGRALRKPKK